MPHVWTRIHGFRLHPAVPINILFILFTFISGILWIGEFSYEHPGPAIAVIAIAVAILIVGLKVIDLQVERQELACHVDALQANNRKLAQKVGNLKKTNRMLFQKVAILQAQCHDLQQRVPERQPRLMGLELLVERWQRFKPKQADSVILHEQFLITQSIAQLADSRDSEFRFINYFPGFKVGGGAFLVQLGQQIPRVLKFDSITNIKAEVDRYKHCVAGQLGQVSGEPVIPPLQPGKIKGEEWGAITYNLIGADQTKFGKVQTFAEYYSELDKPEHITEALNEVFAALKPWWQNSPGPDNCRWWRRRSLYGEYDRLIRRQNDIQDGIRDTGRRGGLKHFIKLLLILNVLISTAIYGSVTRLTGSETSLRRNNSTVGSTNSGETRLCMVISIPAIS